MLFCTHHVRAYVEWMDHTYYYSIEMKQTGTSNQLWSTIFNILIFLFLFILFFFYLVEFMLLFSYTYYFFSYSQCSMFVHSIFLMMNGVTWWITLLRVVFFFSYFVFHRFFSILFYSFKFVQLVSLVWPDLVRRLFGRSVSQLVGR